MTVDLYSWSQARTEALRRLGGRTDSTTSTRMDNWLESAQHQLAKTFVELPRLEQVTDNVLLSPGESEYDLLTESFTLNDLIGILSVRNEGATDGTGTPFRMYRFPFYEYRALSTQSSSQPVRWARHGNLFVVDPEPDKQYQLTIDYRRRPREQTVELDTEWHESWINLAVYYGWKALGQSNQAQAVFDAIPAWLQKQLQYPVQEQEWEQWWDNAGWQPTRAGWNPYGG
jgi:hypothetical protein